MRFENFATIKMSWCEIFCERCILSLRNHLDVYEDIVFVYKYTVLRIRHGSLGLSNFM
jgi:hypothetical protein